MNDDLPKALTKSSSRRDMWKEIQAMQQEIDDQQDRIRALSNGRDELAGGLQAWTDRCHRAEWQLKMIRELAAESLP